MDGTLIDSTPAVMRSWTTWAVEHGIAPEDLLFHHGVPGGRRGGGRPARRTGTRARWPGSTSSSWPTSRRSTLMPGAREALDALAGAPRAIATSCTRPLAACAAGRCRGSRPPESLVTASDVEHGKPSPDPFLAAAERLWAWIRRNCLVVEDAPAGVQAARAAGCAVAGRCDDRQADELTAGGLVVSDLSAVRFVPLRTASASSRPERNARGTRASARHRATTVRARAEIRIAPDRGCPRCNRARRSG